MARDGVRGRRTRHPERDAPSCRRFTRWRRAARERRPPRAHARRSTRVACSAVCWNGRGRRRRRRTQPTPLHRRSIESHGIVLNISGQSTNRAMFRPAPFVVSPARGYLPAGGLRSVRRTPAGLRLRRRRSGTSALTPRRRRHARRCEPEQRAPPTRERDRERRPNRNPDGRHLQRFHQHEPGETPRRLPGRGARRAPGARRPVREHARCRLRPAALRPIRR